MYDSILTVFSAGYFGRSGPVGQRGGTAELIFRFLFLDKEFEKMS